MLKNSRNKLGVKGVHFDGNRYIAKVFFGGALRFCKGFKTMKEAKCARDHHAKIHHGEFSHS